MLKKVSIVILISLLTAACSAADSDNNVIPCGDKAVGLITNSLFEVTKYDDTITHQNGYCNNLAGEKCWPLLGSSSNMACSTLSYGHIYCKINDSSVDIDARTDSNNCGYCNNKCNENQKCVEGLCEGTTTPECQYNEESCKNEGMSFDSENCKCIESTHVVTVCDKNKHLFENTCEDDSVAHCGSHDTNCETSIAGWQDGSCTDAQCVASACGEEQHVFENSCEANSVAHCGNHDTNCETSIAGWKDGSCSKGQCVVTECSALTKLKGNTCVPLDVNDTFTFGQYEQDNNTDNGKEGIEWRVIHKDEAGQYLAISHNVLDAKPFNDAEFKDGVDVTWDSCTIRAWLNGYSASSNIERKDFSADNFISVAFTAEEQAKIVEQTVPVDSNPANGKMPTGNETNDKIFFLSNTEVTKYMTSKNDRKTLATSYAVKRGAYVNNGDSSYNGSCVSGCYSTWWLRTHGEGYYQAMAIDADGSIINFMDYAPASPISKSLGGVRPAIWVKP